MANIQIIRGDSNGTLEMSDNGHTKAKKKESIKWMIDNGSNVNTIESIDLKSGTTNIFSSGPDRVNDRLWKAEIAESAAIGTECMYNIRWRDTSGNSNLFDPVISIKPSR